MTSVMTSAQQALASIQADFDARYKYVIAGKNDPVFQAVADALNNKQTFDIFKSSRTGEAITLRRIAASDADQPTKDKQSGQAKIGFILGSVSALQDIVMTGDAKKIAAAINSLATELNDAVTSYTSGMASSPDAVKDAHFIANVKMVSQQMNGMLSMLGGRLVAAGVIYSIDAVQAGFSLKSVKSLLAAAQAAPATTTSASTTSSSGSTNILV